jgi:hypothetical protein
MLQEKNGTRLYGVLSNAIDDVWEEVAPLIDKSLVFAGGKFHIDDIYRFLKNKEMQLWVVYDEKGLCCSAITQIVIYPRKKIFSINFVAGRNYKTWLDHLNILEAFARSNDCDWIEGYCRKGWDKSLPSFGYKKSHTLYILPLK